jgi:ABC-type nitrate/sulfonate/bicarbonate transport system substrate-binding protein
MVDHRKVRLAAIGIFAMIMILVIAAAGIYYLGQKGSGASVTDNNYTIKVGVNEDCTGIPWFVGDEENIFKADGFSYVNVGQTVTEQRPTALAVGQVDVLDIDPLTLANMIKSGIKVTAVAQSGDSPHDGDLMKEYMHWLVLNSSDLATFESIKTANRTIKIGVSALGTSDDLQTNALLRRYNISKDQIEYVVIPDLNMQQALRRGDIDIAVLRAAFYACAEHNGGVRILAKSTDAFGSSGGTTLLVFKDSFIQQHPETVRKFIVAYKDAERWCNANRAEAARITATHLQICTGDSHYYSESGAIDDSQLQFWIDQMVADGDLGQGDMKPSDLYTMEFNDTWSSA